jgi:hypothetical protein
MLPVPDIEPPDPAVNILPPVMLPVAVINPAVLILPPVTLPTADKVLSKSTATVNKVPVSGT